MFKIGSVPYLNAKPLIEGLGDVVLEPPSKLAETLRAGKIDVGLVPVGAILDGGWSWVPGIAVASPGRTDSVRLHHAVDLPDVRAVALDRNSRTSNLLAQVILERRYGLRPRYLVRDPRRGLSFKGFDAAVTIGDTSFRARRLPFLDLGTEWKAWTGKPFVYAVWAYREGHPRAAEMARVLRQAKVRGLARLDAIARREAARLGLSPRFCRAYLTDSITYDLGPEEREGLRLFARYARERSRDR